VKLYLPRARSDHQVDAPTAPAAWSTPPSTSGLLVLVVEDDMLVRTATAEALRDLGHEVLEAGGVEEALGLMDRHSAIRLVLTDVVMPGASGRVLADAVRQRRRGLPVVFMTGYTRNAIVHNGVVDADALLITKPFTAAQLAAKIQEALAWATARDP
jgi:CheY-like chemotaxis protein